MDSLSIPQVTLHDISNSQPIGSGVSVTKFEKLFEPTAVTRDDEIGSGMNINTVSDCRPQNLVIVVSHSIRVGQNDGNTSGNRDLETQPKSVRAISRQLG